MEWFEPIKHWAHANETILWCVFAGSMALVLVTPLVVGWIVVQLPADISRGSNAENRTRAGSTPGGRQC